MASTWSETPSSKSVKSFALRVDLPKPSCMPLYCLGWKFDFDDDIIIVYEATSNKTNFVLKNEKNQH